MGAVVRRAGGVAPTYMSLYVGHVGPTDVGRPDVADEPDPSPNWNLMFAWPARPHSADANLCARIGTLFYAAIFSLATLSEGNHSGLLPAGFAPYRHGRISAIA